MSRKLSVTLPLALLLVPLAGSCSLWRVTRPQLDPPPPEVRPTRIEYTDTDVFDALLESALVNQDPAILIQTRYTTPEWGDRLNAWIAAWNLGGRVASSEAGKVRMQSAFVPKIVVDGDSIREFRLLIKGLMDRLDERTRKGLSWLAEERVRDRRVKLLKPYNLRFHMDEDGQIEIILFNGRYADYHRDFVRSLGGEGEEWERKYVCSLCGSRRQRTSPTGSTRMSSGSEPPPEPRSEQR
jgi:hypothetical protein